MEELIERSNRAGTKLMEQLTSLSKRHTLIGNVRGKGLLTAFDFADKPSRDKFISMGVQQNVMFLGCGPHTIRFRPALIIQKNNIDQGLNILEDILKKL